MSQTRQPALFISHGAPTLALEDSPTSRFLEELGQTLERPAAIVVVSAHWETPQATIGVHPTPRTIHDFGGFPQVLYTLRYPASTDLALAQTLEQRLTDAGIPVHRDTVRGLDHGAWTPLMRMYPEADVPVVNLSLPQQLDEPGLRSLGRALRSLRAENVLIVASGSYTHNLWAMEPEGSAPQFWATEFAQWVDTRLLQRRDQELDAWQRDAPHAHDNHPSIEHFLPLFVALGAASDDEPARKLHDDWRYGSLSMACWRFD